MNTSRQLTLRERSTAIFAAARQFGKALVGQPGAALSRPVIADYTPILWGGRRMTPDQVRYVLQAAIGGNIEEQWALFDLMEDTWPRLTKNLNEVRRASARTTYTVQPYSERGEKPTPDAIDRADMVEDAIKNWRPKPGTLELSFEDALYNALDAFGKGLSVLEVTWQRNEEGLLPRCAHLLHPCRYGWNADGNELGLVNAGEAPWQEFPPGQFWVGTWQARSGAPGQTALLRCLAPYWAGITFGWEWLLSNAQIFGVPIRWGTYDSSRPELRDQLAAMLENLGHAGWAAFPSGTTLDLKEAVTRATDNPQVIVQNMADKACDLLILGQEASSESKTAGLGSGASELHGAVRDDRLQDAAQWCADLLNYQLVPAVLRWNWGDETDPPTIVPDIASEPDPKSKADRDQILSGLAPLPKKWFYDRHAIPMPEDGEATVGGPAAAPANDPNFPPNGGPSSGSAPGGAGKTALPGSEASNSPQDRLGGTNTAGKGPRGHSVNPPRSAVPPSDALKAKNAAGVIGPPALPGDYQMPGATRQILEMALAKDFAPLRKAAEPLLAAIEAGNLDVVGELEAFIARLDSLAPQMIGASELADALEAGLAQAAISGAAASYAKISPAKP
jgi:phage gp29-like protein